MFNAIVCPKKAIDGARDGPSAAHLHRACVDVSVSNRVGRCREISHGRVPHGDSLLIGRETVSGNGGAVPIEYNEASPALFYESS